MPPAVAAAGVTAGAAIVGGGINAISQNKAGARQDRANAAAQQWEREKYATEQRYRDQAIADYNTRHTSWQNARDALLRSRGIDPGGGGSATAALGGAVARSGGGAPALTLGTLAGAPTGVPDMGEGDDDQGASWNDWGKYGVR